MGDRSNVIVKSGGEQIVFYSHWAGKEIYLDVKSALGRKERWDDFQYLNRIIFCSIVG